MVCYRAFLNPYLLWKLNIFVLGERIMFPFFTPVKDVIGLYTQERTVWF